MTEKVQTIRATMTAFARFMATLAVWIKALPESEEKDCVVEAFNDLSNVSNSITNLLFDALRKEEKAP